MKNWQILCELLNVAPYSDLERHIYGSFVFFDIDFAARQEWLSNEEVTFLDLYGARNVLSEQLEYQAKYSKISFLRDENFKYNHNTACCGIGTFVIEIEDDDYAETPENVPVLMQAY